VPLEPPCIDLEWLSERLCEVLCWQLEHPTATEHADAPEVPWAGRRVWAIFLELCATRTVGGFAPNPISFTEIEAWSRLKREPIRPFELDILQALDATFLKAARVMSEGEKPEEPLGPPMTPSLFRAVFKGERTQPKPTRKFSIDLFDAWNGVYEPAPKKAD